MTKLDIEHLRTWIGREESASELVTAALVQRFRATFDEESGSPPEGEVVPRMLHWCLAQPAVPGRALAPDGHPARGGFLPPVPLPRRMWAGGTLAFGGDIRVGDRVRRVSRVESLDVKERRTGALCFVKVRHRVDVDGTEVVDETHDIVYRDHDTGAPVAKVMEPAPEGAHRRPVDPTPILLFRYSALTFNGHRIHYDHPYATRTEGYPGLIVHGPLQATQLYRFATEVRGVPPSRLTYRGLSPLFDDKPYALHAQEGEGSALTVWTASPGGPVAMRAEASWT